ncbi:MAG: hypothetical protein QG620_215 [Patescibacteria group bacterium]|nr:hypothetical protein [Patescibacteria group bacterium]
MNYENTKRCFNVSYFAYFVVRKVVVDNFPCAYLLVLYNRETGSQDILNQIAGNRRGLK